MKTFILLLALSSSAFAGNVYDENGQFVGTIEGGQSFDRFGFYTGIVQEDGRSYDQYGQPSGYVEQGGYRTDHNGNFAGYVDTGSDY